MNNNVMVAVLGRVTSLEMAHVGLPPLPTRPCSGVCQLFHASLSHEAYELEGGVLEEFKKKQENFFLLPSPWRCRC